MLRHWTSDLRTRALVLRRMRRLITEAVTLFRPDRRRRIDAVIDYFGDPRDRRRGDLRGTSRVQGIAARCAEIKSW